MKFQVITTKSACRTNTAIANQDKNQSLSSKLPIAHGIYVEIKSEGMSPVAKVSLLETLASSAAVDHDLSHAELPTVLITTAQSK